MQTKQETGKYAPEQGIAEEAEEPDGCQVEGVRGEDPGGLLCIPIKRKVLLGKQF